MDSYTVFQSGNFFRFLTKFGLAVELDGYSLAQIYIPKTYKSGMTGICGNFDGIRSNDLTNCDGATYSGTPTDKFGDICVVNDTDSDRPS